VSLDPDKVCEQHAGDPVFNEVQAALLNSECDPNEAAIKGLLALYTFVGTELEGSKIAAAVEEAVESVFFETAIDGVRKEDAKKSSSKNGRKKR
jgi:hypothetical protein